MGKGRFPAVGGLEKRCEGRNERARNTWSKLDIRTTLDLLDLLLDNHRWIHGKLDIPDEDIQKDLDSRWKQMKKGNC